MPEKSENNPVIQRQYGLYTPLCKAREKLILESPFFFNIIAVSVLPCCVSVIPRASLPLIPCSQFCLLAKPCSTSNFIQVTWGSGSPPDLTRLQGRPLLQWCGFDMSNRSFQSGKKCPEAQRKKEKASACHSFTCNLGKLSYPSPLASSGGLGAFSGCSEPWLFC